MGADVPAIVVSYADRRRFRVKVRQCLDVFAQMLRESRFDERTCQIGMEVECNLIDDSGLPSMTSGEVLRSIRDPQWKTELGRFNLELNLMPRSLAGTGLADLESDLTNGLTQAEEGARTVGARVAMVGILPTLREHDLTHDTMSPNPRFRLLNDQICAARGEGVRICLDGPDHLLTYLDSIMPEAACTSVQCHLQVSPESFGRYWNASQAIAGVQVALAANSPYLFERELWRETRIPLIEQAVDTRPDELQTQGVRPRVWFGERWITSVFDLFEENQRYFPPLLPLCGDEDPAEVLRRGDTPALGELALHNGTVYRWNRPVYAVERGKPHVRVENRVLPAGPTVVDTMANAAFFYGLVTALADAGRPVWTQMSFATARDNLLAASRYGIDSHLYWPGLGDVPVTELVLRKLLPLAQEGLCRVKVSPAHADRMLGVIEQRCLTGRTGATWQTDLVHALEQHSGVPRPTATREMMQRYMKLMGTGEPVHSWPVT